MNGTQTAQGHDQPCHRILSLYLNKNPPVQRDYVKENLVVPVEE